MFNTANLEPGKIYAFRTREWHGPRTVVMPGAVQPRRFLGCRMIDAIPCIEVERASGKAHLIAAEAIDSAVPVQYPD